MKIITKTSVNEMKKQQEGMLSIELQHLAARLFGKLFSGREIIKKVEGVMRAGEKRIKPSLS